MPGHVHRNLRSRCRNTQIEHDLHERSLFKRQLGAGFVNTTDSSERRRCTLTPIVGRFKYG